MSATHSRACWRENYREARKVRRFLDAHRDRLPDGWIDLCLTVDFAAFASAARVESKPEFCDPLKFWIKTRLEFKRAGCRMVVA